MSKTRRQTFVYLLLSFSYLWYSPKNICSLALYSVQYLQLDNKKNNVSNFLLLILSIYDTNLFISGLSAILEEREEAALSAGIENLSTS